MGSHNLATITLGVIKQMIVYGPLSVALTKNMTNHPILSNNHPSATANKAIHTYKIRGKVAKLTATSYKFNKV